MNGSIKIDKSELGNKSTFKYEILLNIPEYGKIKATINNTIEYDVSLDKKDITNSVSFDDLKLSEIEDLTKKIRENKTILEFFSDMGIEYPSDNYSIFDEGNDDELIARLMVTTFEQTYALAYFRNNELEPTIDMIKEKYNMDESLVISK